jgi:hypothetical protein
MKKLWNTAAELRAIVIRLDPVTRESAKRLAAMLGPVEGEDPLSAKDAALELLEQALADGLLAAGRQRIELVELSDQQYSECLFVGIAIAQWHAAIIKGSHRDDELFRILSNPSSLAREERLAGERPAERSPSKHSSSDSQKSKVATRGPARVAVACPSESRASGPHDREEDMKGFGCFVAFLVFCGLSMAVGCLGGLLRD